VPLGSFEDSAVAWSLSHEDYEGLVVSGEPMLRCTLRGKRANEDTSIAAWAARRLGSAPRRGSITAPSGSSGARLAVALASRTLTQCLEDEPF
jgi:hypothetical protein